MPNLIIGPTKRKSTIETNMNEMVKEMVPLTTPERKGLEEYNQLA